MVAAVSEQGGQPERRAGRFHKSRFLAAARLPWSFGIKDGILPPVSRKRLAASMPPNLAVADAVVSRFCNHNGEPIQSLVDSQHDNETHERSAKP